MWTVQPEHLILVAPPPCEYFWDNLSGVHSGVRVCVLCTHVSVRVHSWTLCILGWWFTHDVLSPLRHLESHSPPEADPLLLNSSQLSDNGAVPHPRNLLSTWLLTTLTLILLIQSQNKCVRVKARFLFLSNCSMVPVVFVVSKSYQVACLTKVWNFHNWAVEKNKIRNYTIAFI
jgi:hypothetical protein